MKNARAVLWGIIIVLAVIIFVLGAVLLSVVEARIGSKPATQPMTATSTLPVVSPTSIPPSPTPLNPTDTLPSAPSMTVTPPASPTSPSLPSLTPALQNSATPTLQNSATSVPCRAPAGWQTYYVQPGDTLYRLSQAYGITVAQLQRANCLGTSTLLKTGQALFVPPWAPQPTMYFPPTFTGTATFPPLPTSLP
ncbi:MAG: LysM peptidoglycan-binding domain-containing protein [Anaerolineales bacterium]